jgi:hypothetical protein
MEQINQFLAAPDDGDIELFQDHCLKLDVSLGTGTTDSGLELTTMFSLLSVAHQLTDSCIDAVVSIIQVRSQKIISQKLCINITLAEAITLQDYIISAFTSEDSRVRLLAMKYGVQMPASKNQGSWREFVESELFLNTCYCIGRYASASNSLREELDIAGAALKVLVDLAKKNDAVLDALFTETALEAFNSMKASSSILNLRVLELTGKIAVSSDNGYISFIL